MRKYLQVLFFCLSLFPKNSNALAQESMPQLPQSESINSTARLLNIREGLLVTNSVSMMVGNLPLLLTLPAYFCREFEWITFHQRSAWNDPRILFSLALTTHAFGALLNILGNQYWFRLALRDTSDWMAQF